MGALDGEISSSSKFFFTQDSSSQQQIDSDPYVLDLDALLQRQPGTRKGPELSRFYVAGKSRIFGIIRNKAFTSIEFLAEDFCPPFSTDLSTKFHNLRI